MARLAAGMLLPIPPKLLIPCELGSGMLPGAHWTAQVQAPLESSVPWPVVNPVPAETDEEESVAAGGGGAATEAVPAEEPEMMPEVDPVPSCWMARAWNSAKVLSAVGLMAKVIPRPQWLAGVF